MDMITKKEDEQYFILKLLEAALASDEKKAECNAEVDKLIGFFHQGIAIGYDFDLQMRELPIPLPPICSALNFYRGCRWWV